MLRDALEDFCNADREVFSVAQSDPFDKHEYEIAKAERKKVLLVFEEKERGVIRKVLRKKWVPPKNIDEALSNALKYGHPRVEAMKYEQANCFRDELREGEE